jgi:hypothetical protein
VRSDLPIAVRVYPDLPSSRTERGRMPPIDATGPRTQPNESEATRMKRLTPGRHAFIGALLAIAAFNLLSPTATDPEDGRPTLGGIFTLQLRTDKPSYKLGEPIYVLVAVTNVTDDPYRVRFVPPWGMCDLQVTDAQGEVSPLPVARPFRFSNLNFQETAPHSTRYTSYYDSQHAKLGYWTNIKTWGFEITVPGIYTIRAISKVEGIVEVGPRKGEWFKSPDSDKSNAVMFEVVQ